MQLSNWQIIFIFNSQDYWGSATSSTGFSRILTFFMERLALHIPKPECEMISKFEFIVSIIWTDDTWRSRKCVVATAQTTTPTEQSITHLVYFRFLQIRLSEPADMCWNMVTNQIVLFCKAGNSLNNYCSSCLYVVRVCRLLR